MSADIGYSVALCTSTVVSCLVRRYRSEIVSRNGQSRPHRAELDSDNFAGIGIGGVMEQGVKATEFRRVDTLGGRLRWKFSWWWLRMRCASAAIVKTFVLFGYFQGPGLRGSKNLV